MMKSSYRLIVFILLILIALCGANIYITLRSQKRTTANLYQTLSAYQQQDMTYASNAAEQAVKSIHVTNGVNGKDGVDGANGKDGKDGTTTIIHEYANPPAPVNGKDGANGKDGRQIVLGTDPDTGDVVWKYQGDTLWNLLIEKCQLTNSCDKETQ